MTELLFPGSRAVLEAAGTPEQFIPPVPLPVQPMACDIPAAGSATVGVRPLLGWLRATGRGAVGTAGCSLGEETNGKWGRASA